MRADLRSPLSLYGQLHRREEPSPLLLLPHPRSVSAHPRCACTQSELSRVAGTLPTWLGFRSGGHYDWADWVIAGIPYLLDAERNHHLVVFLLAEYLIFVQ